MKQTAIHIGKYTMSNAKPLMVIAGPCVLTDEKEAIAIASHCKRVAQKLGMAYVFKGSYDKANRTSISSYRGPGIDAGLAILAAVKKKLNVPVLTDVHHVCDVKKVAAIVDIIQVPAFLSRQTDLLVACAHTKKIVNVKKGQFLTPSDMKHVAEKIAHCGNHTIVLTERGTCFGYHNLVVDMRGIEKMKHLGYPVVFDATHSVQLPSGGAHQSSGERAYIISLAKAAVALGIAGVFIETHPNPAQSKSDSATVLPLKEFEKTMKMLVAIDRVVKNFK